VISEDNHVLNQTLREVLFSPYYRVHPLEVLRLGYAKLVFSRHRLTDPRDFLAKSLGLDLTGALAGFERWKPKLEGVVSSVWKEAGCQGGVSLEDGIILYGITRALRPKRVIETGVAAGVSTSFIGAALVENQQGTLFSIELPPAESASSDHLDGAVFAWPKKGVGWAIPGEIRQGLGSRHVLILGDVRSELPRLVADLPSVEMFFHDDLHTPNHMLWEYELVWAHISPGGVLISDDANFGWLQFYRKHQVNPNAYLNVQRLTAIRK